MAEFPAMPFWTDAYLADTADLSPTEHGFYFLMLVISWRRRDCALPDDMAWLKRSLQGYSKFHGHTFNAKVPKLLKRFFIQTDGKWISKRLQKERKYLQQQSERNRKAANLRWNNNDLDHANAMRMQCNRNAPTPTPTPNKKEGNSGNGTFPALPNSPEFTAWKCWAIDNKRSAFKRELEQRELENRAFAFDAQWPPGHASA